MRFRGKLEGLGDRVDDFGPAGVGDPGADVVFRHSCVARNTVTSSARYRSMTFVSSGDSTGCIPSEPMFQPMMCSDSG